MPPADRPPSADATPEPVYLDYFERMLLQEVAPWLRSKGMGDWPTVIERDTASIVAAARSAEQQRQRADHLQRNLQQLVDDADAFEREAKRLRVWTDAGPAEAITRAIQKYRAALQAASGTTRDEPGLDIERLRAAMEATEHEPSDDGHYLNGHWDEWAAAIAAEYARLATPDSTP